jgi:hypothetical protein
MSVADLSPSPESKIGALRAILLALLEEHERDGALPTSARFLYYELVQRSQLSKERTGARRPDQNLHDALTDIREDGRIPWDWIVDETRSLDDYTGYPSIKQGVLAKLPYIKLDPWRGRAPMILTEARSVAGVQRPTVSDYRCRIAATNGQCGGFLRTEIAPMLRPGDRVLYFGDWDLSGNQIEARSVVSCAGSEQRSPRSRSRSTTYRSSSSTIVATRMAARMRRSKPKRCGRPC